MVLEPFIFGLTFHFEKYIDITCLTFRPYLPTAPLSHQMVMILLFQVEEARDTRTQPAVTYDEILTVLVVD